MNRQQSFDFFKGLSVLFVIYLHVTTFLIQNISFIELYLRSIATLSVPIFFIISGYFMYERDNLLKSTLKLIKMYLIFCTITIIFNYLTSVNHVYINDMFGFFTGSIGYLWFIRNLIYIQLIYISLNKDFNFFIVTCLLLFLSMFILFKLEFINLNIEALSTFLYIPFGIIINKYNKRIKEININIFVSISLILILMYFRNIEYYINYVDINTIISILLISNILLSNKFNFNTLNYFSFNSIYILFTQYFVINMLSLNFTFSNYAINTLYIYIFVLLISCLLANITKIIINLLIKF